MVRARCAVCILAVRFRYLSKGNAVAREQRKLAAILFADAVGSSRLMGRDESGTVARLDTSGFINVWLGHPDIALEHLGRAQRLDPGGNSPLRRAAIAYALFFLDRYEEAMVVVEQLLLHSPDAPGGLRIGVASAALAGRSDVAHRLATHLLTVDPAFAVSRLRNYLGPFQKDEFVEKYTQALRLAGMPE